MNEGIEETQEAVEPAEPSPEERKQALGGIVRGALQFDDNSRAQVDAMATELKLSDEEFEELIKSININAVWDAHWDRILEETTLEAIEGAFQAMNDLFLVSEMVESPLAEAFDRYLSDAESAEFRAKFGIH
jgi:hypothetical protein